MIYWYSRVEKGLVDFNVDADTVSRIAQVQAVPEEIAESLRLSILEVIPVIPVWVYGTLMKGEAAYDKIQRIAMPEFKPETKIVEGIQLYINPSTPFPCALKQEGASAYMERYLIDPKDIHILNRYEGSLYHLSKMPDGFGYFYEWALGLEGWSPLATNDWRER